MVMGNLKREGVGKMRSLSLSGYVCLHGSQSINFELLVIWLFVALQVPLPPSVYQRLTSSPTLMNLAQALAYHKM